MPFNYQTLKKITSEGLVDSTLVSADFSAGAFTADKIASSAITDAKIGSSQITTDKVTDATISSSLMASSSVDLTGTKVTGVLPVSKGGTNFSSFTANKSVMVNNAGTTIEQADSGLISCNVYTSNGTWTRPTGCTRIKVQVVGGGAGGSGHGEAGGAGGYAERYFDVTSISSVSVTIGGGGGGVNYHNVGGGGGTTSFGPYLSASGGEGARNIGGHTGGRPGIGSGGNINLYGAGGAGHTHYGGGQGGRSYFGGSCLGVHAEELGGPGGYEGWAAPGSGGTGGSQARHRGATGRPGMVVVWNFK